MHDRILNPYLLFKAPVNDMFSAYMDASFHTKKQSTPMAHAYRPALDTGKSLWHPALSVQPRTVRATKKHSVRPKFAPAHKHCLITPEASDDFVLVDRLHCQNPAVASNKSSCAAKQHTETDFVLVDYE